MTDRFVENSFFVCLILLTQSFCCCNVHKFSLHISCLGRKCVGGGMQRRKAG